MTSGIYKIINIYNQKIYVGSSFNLDGRKLAHFNSLRRNSHKNILLQRSYNKHSNDNFIFEVIEYVEDLSKLIEREQHYIDILKPAYNISPTAGSSLGVKLSIETRTKMSISRTGLKRSEEDRQRMSVAAKNRKKPVLSDDSKARISAANKGKPAHNRGVKMTKESRLKMSLAKKGKPSPKKGIKLSQEIKDKIREKRNIKHD